jgi:hypothetical protein
MVTTGGSMDGSISLQKFDLNGNLIWRETYLPDGFGYGGGYSVIQTSDEGYALTGYVFGINHRDILVIKTNATGDSLWTWTYNGTANSIDLAKCIIENSESELLIGGHINNTVEREYFGYLIKMNAIGDTIWTEKVNNVGGITSMFHTQDSNYLIQGGDNITKFNNDREIIWQVPRLVGLNAQGDRTILERTDQYIIYLGKDYWSDYITIVKCDAMGQVSAIDENVVLPDVIDFRCYPNPFNPEITISYTISKPTDIEINVFNVKGQLADVILQEQKIGGFHSITWNASSYTSGVYFIQLIQNDKLKCIKKVSLIK